MHPLRRQRHRRAWHRRGEDRFHAQAVYASGFVHDVAVARGVQSRESVQPGQSVSDSGGVHRAEQGGTASGVVKVLPHLTRMIMSLSPMGRSSMHCELTAVYEPQEDGRIRAYVLEVPGSWCDGRTIEEARA